ncbi:hypothetical protein [Alkaliphilus peptidifermentans]|uniref:Uncharacterized protein n=1 Tax=Alkaliphilus peptidifermentans DSM 18978 TaxID=1120976 RepID=A0A1G5CE28_9FIRM|nr:hypothetical protein [Alkaliphilus peptidifermentans]SCY00528.1 hypothetical protein SAMN03080606_00631 [Alkaliphilus peptidifermentans DSM 18978]
MERKIKILTWLVVASLAVNVYSFLRADRMENNFIDRLNNLERNVTHTLGNETRSFYYHLNELKNANEWVISKSFQPIAEVSSPNELHFDLQWTLSEVEKDANVLLLYRYKNQPDWLKVLADDIGINEFSAPLILSPDNDYEYKIVSEGSLIKATEAIEISSEYYKPTPLNNSGSGSSSSNGKLSSFDISYSQLHPALFDFYMIKDVEAKLYIDNEYESIPLRVSNMYDRKEWSLDFPTEYLVTKPTAIILVIEYEDGAIVEEDRTDEVLEAMERMSQ